MMHIACFRDFVQSFSQLIAECDNDERRIFVEGRSLLADPNARHSYRHPGGERDRFVSGCPSDVVPNLWDRSVEA